MHCFAQFFKNKENSSNIGFYNSQKTNVLLYGSTFVVGTRYTIQLYAYSYYYWQLNGKHTNEKKN